MRQLSNLALESFKSHEAFARGGREPLSASPLSGNVPAVVGLTHAVSLPTKSGAGSFDQSSLAFVLVAEVISSDTMYSLISDRTSTPSRKCQLHICISNSEH